MSDDPHGETLDLATQRDLTTARTNSGQSDPPPPARHPAEIDSQPPAVADTPKLAAAAELGIDPTYLLSTTRTLVDDAMAGVPVYDRDGNYAGLAPSHTAALRGLELLMKATGMLTEQHQHEHTGGIEIRIAAIDPDRLT